MEEQNFKHTIWEYDSIIPPEICDHLIEKYKKYEMTMGIVGSETFDPTIRKVLATKIEKSDWVTSIFHYYGFDANFENFNYKITTVSNPQFLKYEPEMFYKVHSDVSKNKNTESFFRKLTVVLSLSDPLDYTGGEFVVYDGDLTKIKLNQKKGTINVFPSYLTHKVNPIKTGVRYSIVSWILGEPFS